MSTETMISGDSGPSVWYMGTDGLMRRLDIAEPWNGWTNRELTLCVALVDAFKESVERPSLLPPTLHEESPK